MVIKILHILIKTYGVRCKLSLLLGLIGVFCLVTTLTSAKICFLPGGGKACVGDISTAKVKLSETCEGFNLSSPKCTGAQSVCGWECSACENKSDHKKWWKCDKRPVPSGCMLKLTSCSSCNNYASYGYSGNDVTGKCTKLSTSQSCGCGGTQSRTVTWDICSQSYLTGEWGTCSKSDCTSGQTCKNGLCVKTCTDTCSGIIGTLTSTQTLCSSNIDGQGCTDSYNTSQTVYCREACVTGDCIKKYRCHCSGLHQSGYLGFYCY